MQCVPRIFAEAYILYQEYPIIVRSDGIPDTLVYGKKYPRAFYLTKGWNKVVKGLGLKYADSISIQVFNIMPALWVLRIFKASE